MKTHLQKDIPNVLENPMFLGGPIPEHPIFLGGIAEMERINAIENGAEY